MAPSSSCQKTANRLTTKRSTSLNLPMRSRKLSASLKCGSSLTRNTTSGSSAKRRRKTAEMNLIASTSAVMYTITKRVVLVALKMPVIAQAIAKTSQSKAKVILMSQSLSLMMKMKSRSLKSTNKVRLKSPNAAYRTPLKKNRKGLKPDKS